MKHKKTRNNTDDFDMLIKSISSQNKNETFDLELKEKIRAEHLPVWEELTKRFYSPDKRFAVLSSIKNKLEPNNRGSVLGLVDQMNDVFNILNIAEKVGVEAAEQFYLGYGNSAMERYVKYFEYLSISYYAKELARVMGKDLREIYFNNSRRYNPEIKKLEMNANILKKEGTVEMLEEKNKPREPGE